MRSPNPPSDESPPAADSLTRWRVPFWDLGPFLSSDIRDEAAAALRGAASGMDTITQLTGWVARRIAIDHSPRGFGTAMNTLMARRGSQDGKARLLVTMARAAEVPARVVRGVEVRANSIAGRSWAELWAGRWIAVDPVSGEVPARAALVQLGIGERGLAADIVPLLASARFLPLPPP